MVYLTEHISNPTAPSEIIYASSWKEAESLADEVIRVIGRWIEDIYCDDSTADYYQHKLN